jgi:serine/threonine protein kinase
MTDVPSRLTAALADRYRIERQLGQGGMATVYLADDVRHNRKVAIKVLKPELAAVVGSERFLAEIETTAALQHPHILPLFDSGEAGGEEREASGHGQSVPVQACAFRSSRSANSSAEACVASSTTAGATPARCASAQRVAHRHH